MNPETETYDVPDYTLSLSPDDRVMTITPKTRAAAISLNRYGCVDDRIDAETDPERFADVVLALKPRTRTADKGWAQYKELPRVWQRVETQSDYFMPYLDWMRRHLGESVDLGFKFDVLPYVDPVCPTRILTTCEYDPADWGEAIHVAGFIETHGTYNETRCARNIEHYLGEKLGAHNPIPEYKANANGTYSRNPDYATGKRLPPIKCIGIGGLLSAFFNRWLAENGSDAQRATWAMANEYTRKDPSREYQGFHVLDPDGDIDWDGKGQKARYVTWEQFAALA